MSIRATVEKIYEYYANRDIPNVLAAIPDNFCFEWPFDENHAVYSGVCGSKTELLMQLQSLAENFQFNSYSAANILVDGNKAAAQINVNLTSTKTGETFDAKIAHFWTFEGDVPVKLVEYMDTALMKYQCT